MLGLQGGHTVDFIGAFRVVSIANKSVFERLTVLDGQTMTMCDAHPCRAAADAKATASFLLRYTCKPQQMTPPPNGLHAGPGT